MSERPVTVLIIEDNLGDARLIQELLAEAAPADAPAATLVHADRVSKGLLRLAEGRIDVVLLDLGLPDGQGLDVVLRVHAQAPDVPIVVLTGTYDDEQLAVQAVQKGAQDYLVKAQLDGKMLLRVLRYAIERKALETQLLEAQKFELIGQLAAGIAHEINTPIQYIGSNMRFLQAMFDNLSRFLEGCGRLLAAAKRGPVPPELLAEVEALAQEAEAGYLGEEIPKAMQQSLEGVECVANIVRSVRELSHPGKDQKAPIDLNHMLELTIAMAHSEWRYVAEMVMELDPSLPPVPCLEGAIQQAVLNIVVNAAQAITEVVGSDGARGKGTITVSTHRCGPWAEIRIRDTGRGIPRAIHPKIFSPFFTTKEVGRGTGQGLSIAHSIIVRQHGGTIRFETMEGRGTAFIIRLPIHPATGGGVQASEHTSMAKGGEGDVASGVVRG